MGLRQELPNTDFRGEGHDSSLALLPAFAANMFAAYVFINSRSGGAGLDLSGNGRNADVSNAEILDNHLSLGFSINKKVTYPFTGTQVAAANNAFTIITIAKVPVANEAYLAGSVHGSEDGQQLIVETNNNGKASIYSGGSTTHSIMNNGAADANRTTRYEMFAGTYTPTRTGVYRRYDGGTLASNIINVSKTLGGNRNFTSGINSLNNNYPGPYDHAATVFLNRELSEAELEAAYQGLKSYESIFGVAV